MARRRKRTLTHKQTLNTIAAGGIGSFLLVLLFPHGVKYFFRNWFAELIRTIVIVSLTGLLTQKMAENITRYAKSAQRSSR